MDQLVAKGSWLQPPAVERCARYYHFLRTACAERGIDTVPSSILAECAGVTDSQVRRDLGSIGVKGIPRVGSRTVEVIASIERALGFNRRHRAVVIGAGHLGGALARYPGFVQCGLVVEGLFDSDPRKIGREVAGIVIQPVQRIESVIKKRKVCLAAITTPASAAQETADRVVRAGVKAVWNFAPAALRVPSHVFLRNENLSAGLAVILAQLSSERLPSVRPH